MFEDEFGYEANVRAGVYDGGVRALQKWYQFLGKLCCTPKKTIGELTNDLQAVGTTLYKIAERASQFTPAAYLDDIARDMLDGLVAIKNREGDDAAFEHNQSSRMMQRTERNAQYLQDGLYGAVHIAQFIIDDMMQKSLQQNVAGITEIAVDTFITGKVTDCLMKIAEIVGTPILHAVQELQKSIPADLSSSRPIFMQASNGELIAIADTTGESIGAAIAAKNLADNAQQIIKRSVQAKELTDKISEITKADQGKVEAFQKSIEPYLNSEKIINVERLKTIENIEQIELYKKYTNNFHPDSIAKLKPEEILHLNLCDWLEPQARKINASLKKKRWNEIC